MFSKFIRTSHFRFCVSFTKQTQLNAIKLNVIKSIKWVIRGYDYRKEFSPDLIFSEYFKIF